MNKFSKLNDLKYHRNVSFSSSLTYKNQNSIMEMIARHFGKTTSDAIMVGLIGGAIEYIRRGSIPATGPVQSFLPVNVPEAIEDGVILALESAWADLLGEYALPAVENALHLNQMVQNGTAMIVPPVLVGGMNAIYKGHIAPPGSYTRPGGDLEDFLVGAGAKFIASEINTRLFGV